MKHRMNKKVTIWLILAIVAVALFVVFWATIGRLHAQMERWQWGRLDLTNEQREEIDRLLREMTAAGASPEVIRVALAAKLDEWHIRQPRFGDIELFYIAKTVISSVNLALLICLLIVYIDIYRKTKSKFTIGLIIFSLVFLLNAIASSPIMQGAFGFSAFGLGPFAMLPDLFTCIALSVLLYLSLKY